MRKLTDDINCATELLNERQVHYADVDISALTNKWEETNKNAPVWAVNNFHAFQDSDDSLEFKKKSMW